MWVLILCKIFTCTKMVQNKVIHSIYSKLEISEPKSEPGCTMYKGWLTSAHFFIAISELESVAMARV